MEARTVKSGPFTLALGLIALGAGILASNLGLVEIRHVLKYWPLLLIGLGLEYFIRKLTAGEKEVQFSLPAAVLIGLMMAGMAAASAVYGLVPGWLMHDGLFGGKSEYKSLWQGQPVQMEPGSRLEIENRMGDIYLAPSPDGRMHLSAGITGRGTSGGRARAAAEAQKIEVQTGPVTRVYTGPGNNTAVSLRLEVPAGLNISVSNMMGTISAQGITAETIDLRASMGRIEVEKCSAKVSARNRVGEVSLRDVSGDADVDASLGKISIYNPRGNISAASGSGEVNLASDRPLDKKYTVRTDLGQINFRLPRESDLKIQASTQHGGITGMGMRESGQTGQNRGELTLGGGAGTALLETKSGAVRVEVTG